jgi:Flp pilus assembly protein TadD
MLGGNGLICSALIEEGEYGRSLDPCLSETLVAPYDPQSHYRLAFALLSLGLTGQARDECRAALALDPGHEGALALMRIIEGGAAPGNQPASRSDEDTR